MESLEFNHGDRSPQQPMDRYPFLPVFFSDSVQRPSLCTKYLVSLDNPIREAEPYQVHANVNIRTRQDERPGEDEILRVGWTRGSSSPEGTRPQHPKDREGLKQVHLQGAESSNNRVPCGD
jgi:hypothetical protein